VKGVTVKAHSAENVLKVTPHREKYKWLNLS
jgi:hypothetical protein